MHFLIGLLTAFYSFFIFALPVSALSPDEVLVVANRNAAKSLGLATWYMEKRQIPKENLLAVFVTDKETCSRETYLKKIAPPVRRALEKAPKLNAIVTMYGLPLRISSPGITKAEQTRMDRLAAKKKRLRPRKKKPVNCLKHSKRI